MLRPPSILRPCNWWCLQARYQLEAIANPVAVGGRGRGRQVEKSVSRLRSRVSAAHARKQTVELGVTTRYKVRCGALSKRHCHARSGQHGCACACAPGSKYSSSKWKCKSTIPTAVRPHTHTHARARTHTRTQSIARIPTLAHC